MPRQSSTSWDVKPHKPIRYGPFTRLADRWAGRNDGKAGIPPVPAEPPEVPDPALGKTPYLDIRTQHFRDRSERERRHVVKALEEPFTRRRELDRKIKNAEETLAELQERLGKVPETAPEDQIKSRNVVEQNASEELIRARRQREHTARRSQLVAKEEQLSATRQNYLVQRDQVDEVIGVQCLILDSRVNQLHRHTLRRVGTYLRRLQRKHPAGAAVLPYLNLALPALPEWLSSVHEGYHSPDLLMEGRAGE